MSYSQISYYKALIQTYGEDREVVGWGSEDSQHMRFKVMCEHLEFSGHTVLDVGCGRADLFKYLELHDCVPMTYTGLDLVEEMVGIARRHCPKGSFIVGDFNNPELDLDEVDFVVSSGVFNLEMVDHENWMKAFVNRMFNLARVAVAFNVVSHYAVEHKNGFYYADPSRWLTFCMSLTPYVCVRHDYASHDVSFILFKNARN